MRIVEAGDYSDLCERACEMVAGQLRAKPDSVCVFPTGQTPLGLFRRLAAAHRAGRIDTRSIRIVTLDEYAGIAADDPRRLFLWLQRALLRPLGIAAAQIHALDPAAADPALEAARFEAAIADFGGIDLAVLGLGANGHIGFNEPGSPFESRTRLVTLSDTSIEANAAYWGKDSDVPPTALTMGLGTILEARAIVLLASGKRKAGILSRAIHGPIGPDVPATSLRRHPDATVIADREALSHMSRGSVP
jgi:glucosamine-6-phosphate deaminase